MGVLSSQVSNSNLVPRCAGDKLSPSLDLPSHARPARLPIWQRDCNFRTDGRDDVRFFGSVFGLIALAAVTAIGQEDTPGPSTAPAPAASQPAINPAPGVEQQTFDPSQKLLGDPFNLRGQLAGRGITFDPLLLVDYTKVLHGGLNTRSESYREH